MKKRYCIIGLLACLCTLVLIVAGCSPKAAMYKDGTYNATAQGYGGEVKVSVTIQGGKINAIDVIGDSETQEVAKEALDTLPKSIVLANSTKVDGIAGATVTSNAVKNAVDEALKQAGQ